MKKFFTLCLALLVSASLFAQEEEDQLDRTFRFIDKNGTEVPDGSVLNLTDLEESIFGGTEINSGLYIENTSSTSEYANVTLNISSITAKSTIQFCLLMSCNNYTEPGSYLKSGILPAGSKNDLQLEWSPADEEDEVTGEIKHLYGSCSATLMIEHMDASGKFVEGTGPTITLNFTYADPAGIKDVDAKAAKSIVARYNANGQLLTAPQKGLNIVKYADGTSAKVLVK